MGSCGVRPAGLSGLFEILAVFVEPRGHGRAYCSESPWLIVGGVALSVVQADMLRTGDWSSSDDERDLINRAKRDRDAFAELYRRHSHGVAAHIYRRTGDPHATEDLVADVFLAALRALPRYRYRGVPLRFWLLRIATNAVNRWVRRRRRGATADLHVAEDVNVDAGSSMTDGEVDAEHALRALLRLAPKYQAVLSLHYLEGLSVREVAAVVGCRAGTVKSRLARARDALRARLTERR